jgi:zinc transport system substrate-binding protein
MMQQIVKEIRDAYVRVDPANQVVYDANAVSYTARLEALHNEFEAGLAGYSNRKMVTSHNAFGYLARRYRLENIFISGITPEAEPSPQKLAEISRLVREQGIKYVFFETLVSPALAETVAREAGARTLVLNPLEGLTDQQIASGENYISVMRDNLANLKTALDAQP